jgi:hypothetical protein
LLHILSAEEVMRIEELRRQQVRDINEGLGAYAKVSVVRDEDTGLYELYYEHSELGASTTWQVPAKPPPIADEDFIATCTSFDDAVVVLCRPPMLVGDRIGIETTVRAEHLPYLSIIQNHASQLVQSWRMTE